ncbi:MAG: ribonuclease III [Proteobacteria bacterium]|nr:ribonuclease III [Pseudomonadota bacterium]
MAVRDPLGSHPPPDPLTLSSTQAARGRGAIRRAPADTDNAAADVEAILGYQFREPRLLREALTHRSAAGAGRGSNERLEFLGDRVLGLAVAVWLSEQYPREQEGALGRRLAHLVSQPVLARIAEELGLPALLSVAPGEARAGVRRRASVLADAVEALLGAMFLDGGLDPVQRFVRARFEDTMIAEAEPPKDAKTALQEWGQGRALGLPVYEIESREGPSHAPHFVVRVSLGGETEQGQAGTRRAAEQAAAQALLTRLRMGMKTGMKVR